MKIIRTDTYEAMSRQAANLISAQIILKPDTVLGLATGSTPLGIYRQLIEWRNKGDLDFSQVTTVNLDEYCGLPPAHPQSYRHFMDLNFFGGIGIDPARTHVPNGMASDLAAECARNDEMVAGLGGIDLQLLGIGRNGHIGFNEPSDVFKKGTHVVDLKPSTIEANARFFSSADEVPRRAITIGIQAIMAARRIVLVASGAEKRGILERALHGPVTPQVPASLLQLHTDLTVVCSTGETDAHEEWLFFFTAIPFCPQMKPLWIGRTGEGHISVFPKAQKAQRKSVGLFLWNPKAPPMV